jgi:O-antigen ligase
MILKTSIDAASHLMPLGSGVGSFENIYRLYEDHERLDPNTIVNHAHNDYVEIAMETGVPGLIVLALFLAWWGIAVWRVWKNDVDGPYARAAAVASAAILAHSVVDFPLRTAAISAFFAMCLGLLTLRRRPKAADSSSLWPTRHVVVR